VLRLINVKTTLAIGFIYQIPWVFKRLEVAPSSATGLLVFSRDRLSLRLPLLLRGPPWLRVATRFDEVLEFVAGCLEDFIGGGSKAAFLETLSGPIMRNRKVMDSRETGINKPVD
jgi:hypothetical protein